MVEVEVTFSVRRLMEDSGVAAFIQAIQSFKNSHAGVEIGEVLIEKRVVIE